MNIRFVQQPNTNIPEATLDAIEDAIEALEDAGVVRFERGQDWLTVTRIGAGAAVRFSWDEPAIHDFATVRRARQVASRALFERYGIC
jgi:hypothetical protein